MTVEESPKFQTTTVQLFPGERRAGLWCSDCLLSSGILQVVHVGRPDSETTVTIARCTRDPLHTRIEENE